MGGRSRGERPGRTSDGEPGGSPAAGARGSAGGHREPGGAGRGGRGRFGAGAGAEWERVGAAGRVGDEARPPAGAASLSSLIALLDAARAAVPRELERQVTALLRELLLTLRALIDWYLERLDDGRERRVEDIPIE